MHKLVADKPEMVELSKRRARLGEAKQRVQEQRAQAEAKHHAAVHAALMAGRPPPARAEIADEQSVAAVLASEEHEIAAGEKAFLKSNAWALMGELAARSDEVLEEVRRRLGPDFDGLVGELRELTDTGRQLVSVIRDVATNDQHAPRWHGFVTAEHVDGPAVVAAALSGDRLVDVGEASAPVGASR